MKKALLICGLAISFMGNQSFAQTDAKAKGILESVTKKVNTLKTLKANFTLKITGGKVNESKKGSISIKGQKYHLVLNGQEVICDGKTLWTYNPDAKEVTISSYNPSEQTITPAKLLTNFYDKEYRYKYIGEKKDGGKACDAIELTPIDNAKQVSKIELLIDKSTSLISGGQISSKNGNKTQYGISNVVQNPNIPDAFFTWDAKAHPGVETNDMR